MTARKTKVAFIEPMLLLRTERLPDGKDWLYEVKFDGYRVLAIKSGGKVQLRSRNDNDFAIRYTSCPELGTQVAHKCGGDPDLLGI
jgi:bifunctional non-homologous end joining protein LigD